MVVCDTRSEADGNEGKHERIAGSEMHMIPLAAHMSNMENPAFFNEKLPGFLDRAASITP